MQLLLVYYLINLYITLDIMIDENYHKKVGILMYISVIILSVTFLPFIYIYGYFLYNKQ